jgi:hypothetical protein
MRQLQFTAIIERELEMVKLEEKHRAGYARYPVKPGEFEVWEAEQSWPVPPNFSESQN